MHSKEINCDSVLTDLLLHPEMKGYGIEVRSSIPGKGVKILHWDTLSLLTNRYQEISGLLLLLCKDDITSFRPHVWSLHY